MAIEWTYDIEAGCINGDDFWYVSMQFSGLFHLNLQTGLSTFLGSIPNEKKYKDRLYGSMHFFNNKLFLVPFSAETITVYDIVNNEFVHVSVCGDNNKPEYYDENYKWQGSVLYENKIFMFGLTHSSIGIFDCLNMKFNINQEWVECYEKEYGSIEKTKYEFYFEKNIVLDGDCIYVLLGFSNKLMKYSLSDEKISFIEIGNKGDVFYGLIKVADRFVLTHKNSTEGIIIWNPENNIIEERLNVIGDMSCAYASNIPLREFFMVATSNGKETRIYNYQNKEYQNVEQLRNYTNVYYFDVTNDFLVIYSASIHKIVKIDKEILDTVEYDLYFDDGILEILKTKIKMDTTENIIMESEFAGLGNYISMLVDMDNLE